MTGFPPTQAISVRPDRSGPPRVSPRARARHARAARPRCLSPPLRPVPHQEALWRGLAAKEIDTVGTDHCPFGYASPPHKQRGLEDFSKIPNGAPGIETRLMLLWDAGVRTGRMTPERFVEVTAAAPARLFGLWPRKGAIAEGSDADIVLWDPEKTITLSASTHHMRVDYSLYEGRAVTGAPDTVLSRGEVIVRRGAFCGRKGRGRFLKRAAAALLVLDGALRGP